MALVMQQRPIKTDLLGQYGTRSESVRTCTLQIPGTDEELTVPVMIYTRVSSIRDMLADRLGIDGSRLTFVVKRGPYWRAQHDLDEVASKVSVRGIKTFRRVRTEHRYPLCLVGSGHMGLRIALHIVREKINYVHVDRHDRVGGLAWIDHANKYSKVQTELGTYHLPWLPDSDCPQDVPPWPSRDELLGHFDKIADEYGMKAHMLFSTNMTGFDIIKEDPARNIQHYDMKFESTKNVDGDGQPAQSRLMASGVWLFPGNLTNPRRVTYTGEEEFGGSVCYGMFDEADYDDFRGKQVAIVGQGAFAVENVRTCLEHSVTKVYVVTRRKNLCMPRMISWWINGSLNPIPAGDILRACESAYKMIGEDPWEFYAVTSNEARTNVTINQKARFGITDVYFLARYYGKCELIVASVRRLTQGMMHLDNGRKLEVSAVLKLLGFTGDWAVDKLMKLKELTGWWCDYDYRRAIVSEFTNMNAQRFSGTSLSPGASVWASQLEFFYSFPLDWNKLVETQMMPKSVADQKKDKPAYVMDARTGSTMLITISSLSPFMAEYGGLYDDRFKRTKQWGTHSLKEIQAEAEKEWMRYCAQFQDEGDDRPFPPYLYSLERMEELVEEQDQEAEKALRAMQAAMANA